MEPRPHDFDWVAERGNCSLDKVFAQLRLLAQQNVDARNRQAAGQAGLNEEAGDFSICNFKFKAREGGQLCATFRLRDDAIHMSCPRGKFQLGLALDEEGYCKCSVRGDDGAAKVLDLWQVLRLALEPVLFPMG